MQCPRCNAPLVADARFCGVCGNSMPAQNGRGPESNPSAFQPVHDDATLVESAWSPQTPPQPMRQTPQPGSFPPPQQPTQAVWSPANQPQNAPWPQQPPQGVWSPPNQQPTAYPQGMLPGTMNSTGGARSTSKRQRKWPLRVALVLVILLVVLAGSWFLGVRPYLNNLAKTQLNQALSEAQSEISVLKLTLPTGSAVIPITEANMNSYLSAHASAPLENLHVTIIPTAIRLDFKVYGFSCTVLAVPIPLHGVLQVTNVQIQGLLGLALSSDELTTLLNNSLQSISHEINRSVDGVTLHNQVMDLQIH